MKESNNTQEALHSYHVWDRSVRIFHWVNAVCVMGLMVLGLAILYNSSFEVSSDGKILLKTLHVYFGYVFVFNLLWRISWFFFGNQYSSWREALPFGGRYRASLKSYIKGSKQDNPPQHLGHNPVGKMMVALLFILLIEQAMSGLILAGTDLYFPPFGSEVAEWVAVPSEEGSTAVELKPGSKENVDPDAYKEMRAVRKPIATVHKYVFYILLTAIFLHILGVVRAEVKERSGLISAMFTGKKVFSKKPVDMDD